MKRFGKPEEVIHLVTFLLSDQSRFINGTVIPIDADNLSNINILIKTPFPSKIGTRSFAVLML